MSNVASANLLVQSTTVGCQKRKNKSKLVEVVSEGTRGEVWDRQDVKERNVKGQMVLNFPKKVETVVKKGLFT